MITNEQRMLSLIATNHTIANALLAERLMTISDITRKAIAKNPESFRTPFNNEHHYLKVCDAIDAAMGSEEPEQTYVLFMDAEGREQWKECDADVDQFIEWLKGNEETVYFDSCLKSFDCLHSPLEVMQTMAEYGGEYFCLTKEEYLKLEEAGV